MSFVQMTQFQIIPTASDIVDRVYRRPDEIEVFDRDSMITVCMLGVWWLLDGIVLTQSISSGEITENWFDYLTNEVFCFGILSKFLLSASLIMAILKQTHLDQRNFDFVAYTLYASFGACLCGVYGAFFSLTYMNDSILAGYIDPGPNGEEPQNTIGEVVLWNHVRHVLPLLLHVAILWSCRSRMQVAYLISNYNHRVASGFAMFLIPCAIGLEHLLRTDDKALYKFTKTIVGTKCSIIFVTFSLLANFYYVAVVAPPRPQSKSTSVSTPVVSSVLTKD